ncbi:MAG: FkbM family methyltransferase [Ignavibacteriae bacterium]|nr:FkbM family methyltransferase [Ignavibacteriota bacterium]
MREALIQFIQRLLKRRYNKVIAEIKDPFRDMARILSDTTVRAIVDGGAYRGEVALQLASLFPHANVYAFEPSHTSFATLREAVAHNPRITPVPFGLSSSRKTATLYVNAQDSTNSLSPVGDGGKIYQSWQTANVGKEEVDILTLDEWADQNGIGAIDVIKLDLQGHELHALNGALKMLRSSVKVVYTEVEFLRVYEENCLMYEVEGYLRELGFELFQLYNLTSGDDNQLVCGDAVFVSRERLKVKL